MTYFLMPKEVTMGTEHVSNLIANSHFSHISHHISERNKVTKSLNDGISFINTKRNKSNYSGAQAMNRANYIAQKLNNPSRLGFYLKCAWNLTDNYLDRLLGIALTKDDPIRYFSASAAREMRDNG